MNCVKNWIIGVLCAVVLSGSAFADLWDKVDDPVKYEQWADDLVEVMAFEDEDEFLSVVDNVKNLAEDGNVLAWSLLGNIYVAGMFGNEIDVEKGLYWYRRAADEGFHGAQNKLGHAYEDGVGVDQDYVEAVRWYRLAANQGYSYAQYNLGRMYVAGQGVDVDYDKAHMLFRLAAEQKNSQAYYKLGKFFLANVFEKDPITAYMWFSLIPDYADMGKEELRKLEVSLSAEDITEAKDRVAKCKAQDYKGC